MHPAQHRGLRELHAMARRLREHWRTLADRLEPGAPGEAALLREGATTARALLGELSDVTAARGVHGRPLAQGLGARLAGLHGALLDTTLEVNQALRLAVLDVVHVVMLLDYLARVARRDGDEELAAFLAGWAGRMGAHEAALRTAAVALGEAPGLAVTPSRPGARGRVGHGAATALGTLGEWVDGRYGR